MDIEIAACRCNGSTQRPANDYVAPKKTSKAQSREVTVAPAGPTPFCNKCGWAEKSFKHVDRQTKAIVMKTSCTNKQCPNYRM